MTSWIDIITWLILVMLLAMVVLKNCAGSGMDWRWVNCRLDITRVGLACCGFQQHLKVIFVWTIGSVMLMWLDIGYGIWFAGNGMAASCIVMVHLVYVLQVVWWYLQLMWIVLLFNMIHAWYYGRLNVADLMQAVAGLVLQYDGLMLQECCSTSWCFSWYALVRCILVLAAEFGICCRPCVHWYAHG